MISIVSSAVKILRLDFQINRTSIKNSKNLVIKNPTKETTVEGTLTDLVYWHVLIRSTSKLAWFAYLTLFPLERYTFYHLHSMYIKWQSLGETGLIKPMNNWFLKMNHVFRHKLCILITAVTFNGWDTSLFGNYPTNIRTKDCVLKPAP